MKITAAHYNYLETKIKEKHADMLSGHAVDYQKYLQNNNAKRISWDLLRAAELTPFVCNNLYPYLNDTHIETAILKITKGFKP